MSWKQCWTAFKLKRFTAPLFAFILPTVFLPAILYLTGCTVPNEIAPIIAGEGGRMQLLQKSVDSLHKSIQWQSPPMAAEVVSARIFPAYFAKMIGGDPRNTKVVDVNLADIKFDTPEPGKATSTSEVRVYGSPTYAVRTVTTIGNWEYNRMNGGWLLIEVKDPEPTTKK